MFISMNKYIYMYIYIYMHIDICMYINMYLYVQIKYLEEELKDLDAVPGLGQSLVEDLQLQHPPLPNG